MAYTLGDPPLLSDSDVDALAWQFLNSAYADKTYADWPLDRRLDGFLRRRGLSVSLKTAMHTASSLNVS